MKENTEFADHFKIIKDSEDEIFYAITQKEHDEENEWSIVASGKTEKEAMENLTIEIYQKYKNCYDKIMEFCKSISHRGQVDIIENFYLKYHYIHRELIFDGYKSDQFDAMIYDEQTKSWYRSYR